MIKTSVISKNYAKALLEAAQESGDYSCYATQLEEIINVLNNSKDLQIVMANSAISTSKKIEIVNEIFGNKIDHKLLNFIKILIEKNRFNEFETIKEIYNEEISKLSNKTKVEITSPIDLDFEKKTAILFKLEHKLNTEVIPIWNIDESLIAGLIFKIGDCVIDTSVKTKLENLSNEINR